jgi:hypothetical protein
MKNQMKIRKRVALATIYYMASVCHANSQSMSYNLELTKEIIVKKEIKDNENLGVPQGRYGEKILFFRGNADNTFSFFYFNEHDGSFTSDGRKIYLPKERKRYFYNLMDSLIFYSERFRDINNPFDDGYQRLIIRISDKEILLDSIFNADKNIHSNFSTDGKILLVNTLTTLLHYYNPSQDDQFIVYDLDKLRKGKVHRTTIPCKHCAQGHLIGDKLFFTQSSTPDDFDGGFNWQNIYVAPWGRLKDSVKIAFRADIKATTPDGRYILAENNDLPNGVCVIIDVQAKKYQLLLGRDYERKYAFYSYEKKKFAFDFGEYIVYVDFPSEYPFDALKSNLQFRIDGSSKAIRKQFQHKPLE